MEPWRRYLGDNIYIEYDGHGVALSTSNTDDTLYLEPSVVEGLCVYLAHLRQALNAMQSCHEQKGPC